LTDPAFNLTFVFLFSNFSLISLEAKGFGNIDEDMNQTDAGNTSIVEIANLEVAFDVTNEAFDFGS